MGFGTLSRPRARRWVALAALATAGAACERSEKPTRPAAPPRPASAEKAASLEPCRLLTLDEASAFLRGQATPSSVDKLSYATSCIWEARDPRRGLQVMTSTAAQLRGDESMRSADADTLDKRFARLVESQAASGDGAPVPGLGDAALWSEKAAQLWILDKERALVTISFHGEPRASDARERCVAVAKRIVARL